LVGDSFSVADMMAAALFSPLPLPPLLCLGLQRSAGGIVARLRR
jgi:hypothetical protein